MGRLFWKTFLLITLVQMITVLVVGISITLHHDAERHVRADGSSDPRLDPYRLRVQ